MCFSSNCPVGDNEPSVDPQTLKRLTVARRSKKVSTVDKLSELLSKSVAPHLLLTGCHFPL